MTLHNSEYVNFDIYKGFSLKKNAPQDIVDVYNAYKDYWKNKSNAA